jgi:hypothetical protein
MTELTCADCGHLIEMHLYDGCSASKNIGDYDRNWRQPCPCKWNRQTAEAFAYAAELKMRLEDSLEDRRDLAERLTIATEAISIATVRLALHSDIRKLLMDTLEKIK